MKVSAARLLATTAIVLALGGCAPAEPVPDIDALADEMRPVVTQIAQLGYTDEISADYYFAEVTDWCGNPPDPEDRGKERYYEYIPRNGMEQWGANGFTVETLTDAVRELLVIPGWTVEETTGTHLSGQPHDAADFVSTDFEARPDDGGAFVRVGVYGTPDQSVSLNILAMTACVPAGDD